jgi:hypothetical protein
MLRKAHGRAAALGRTLVVETPPADELGIGTPAEPSGRLAAVARTASGQVASREAAAELGRAGARRRAEIKAASLAMLHGFGLEPDSVPPELLPYLDHAEDWCAAEVARVAREVGGGVASPSVAALVQQAGLALAHSRHATAEGRHADAVRYGQEVRANILAGHHLAALESKARGASQASSEAW